MTEIIPLSKPNRVSTLTVDADLDLATAGKDILATAATFDSLEVDGAAITPASVYATGDIKWTAVNTVPAGWLLCDGSAVSRTTYAALFAAIGTAFGVGNGSTTFNLPPKGVVAVAFDAADGDFDAIGHGAGGLKAGGEKTHALSVAELATHKHTIPTAGGGGVQTRTSDISSNAGTVTDRDTSNAGSGTAHENMSPYTVFKMLVKT